MSNYEITVYTRDELTFGRDDDGNFTVTVNKDATPETIKIHDKDQGEDGKTFSGSTAAGDCNQEAYGEIEGESLDGEAIQPLAALPGEENPDDQVMAIGVGDPVHTIVYGFSCVPTPGETLTFDYDSYDSSPSYSADELYVEGEEREQDDPSDANEDPKLASAEEEKEESSTAGGSSSRASKSSKASEASGPSRGEESSKSSSASSATEASKSSGASGGSKPSGDEEASGSSGGSKGSGSSGSSGGSSSSGPSGGGSAASSPPCFTRGTAIRTARGEILVEDLIAGDMVWTEGHGMQAIRWICQRTVPANGEFSPIKISAGTLGADRDILVSPAHRMVVQGPEIEVLFGMPKALVAAKDLVNATTITRVTTLESVEYFHILFDKHEVLEAHGTLSESFFPQADVIGGVGAAQRDELFSLFPELEFGNLGYSIAYPGLMAHEMALVAV